MANWAIWIDKNCKPSIHAVETNYEPLDNEVLVNVQYSGINPADIKHATIGFYDSVAGYDFAGIVIKSGREKESQFKQGDRVLGFAAPTVDKPQQYGTHQDFHCARHFIYHVPVHMPMTDAACLLVVTHTAADAIFNQLELPLSPNGDKSQPLLIWGGSGAVGSSAIQFAKKAGCHPILVTASPKNHSKLLELGATECFDYNDKEVVSQIRLAVARYTSKPLRRVFDSIVAPTEPSSTALCEACVDDASDTLFTSPIPVKNGTKIWRRSFACRNVDVDFKLPNGQVLIHRANHDLQDIIDQATKWAIENYGKEYRLPSIVVVKGGEEGMQAMRESANGKASMQKFVIEHPI
ncbi:NAD(P)-binding protein [Penicillium verhagenii]|uniref:NAD(P)-binding protein n=1 Tax=Penicillium verhagenii TaxID=1562060 RepID=UPI00254564DC|nr:NAD(P)-binding protein [Penicillium verhagenii]KAJ5930385.1 NAD(P)-binding protein [Penicillium verhagenii]